MTKVLVDVNAMFGGKSILEKPQCSLEICDKSDGDWRFKGVCHRAKWCSHARRDPKAVSSYRDPTDFINQSIYEAVKPAILKMQRSNCQIAFWTTRPKSQTVQIIEALKRAKVWDEALLLSESKLLYIEDLPQDFDYSVETAKLSILERFFGEDLKQNRKIIAIEADPLEASILKNYNPSIIVLMAPLVWLNVIATDPKDMHKTLNAEQKNFLPGISFRRINNESSGNDN